MIASRRRAHGELLSIDGRLWWRGWLMKSTIPKLLRTTGLVYTSIRHRIFLTETLYAPRACIYFYTKPTITLHASKKSITSKNPQSSIKSKQQNNSIDDVYTYIIMKLNHQTKPKTTSLHFSLLLICD